MFYKKIKSTILIIVLSLITYQIAVFLLYNTIGLNKLNKATGINKEFEGIITDMKFTTRLTTNIPKENIIGNNIFGSEITFFDGKKIFVSNGRIAYKVKQGESLMTGYSYYMINQPNKRMPAKKYSEFVIHVPMRNEFKTKIEVFLSGGGITLGYLNKKSNLAES